MRMATLALLIFCAVISGWTPALAKIQAHGAAGHSMLATPSHRPHASTHDAAGDKAGCAAGDTRCGHSSKSVHPPLCAACFAVESVVFAIAPARFTPSSPEPAPQAAMTATDLKPRFPPPKAISRR